MNSPSHEPAASQAAANGLGFIPGEFAGVPANELSGERIRGVNQAGAFFPAAPPLFDFSGARVLDMSGFALLAVPAIEFERHELLRPF
jgi:hypothetical protein